MTATSSWRALQNPTFRRLWIATVVSGTFVSAHDTAATWMMNSVSQSTLFLSLISTAATLPFFLFILPAGALADIAERKKVLYGAYIGLAVCACGLAILGSFHLLTPYVRLSIYDRDGFRDQRPSVFGRGT
jgi:MFS family permease